MLELATGPMRRRASSSASRSVSSRRSSNPPGECGGEAGIRAATAVARGRSLRRPGDARGPIHISHAKIARPTPRRLPPRRRSRCTARWAIPTRWTSTSWMKRAWALAAPGATAPSISAASRPHDRRRDVDRPRHDFCQRVDPCLTPISWTPSARDRQEEGQPRRLASGGPRRGAADRDRRSARGSIRTRSDDVIWGLRRCDRAAGRQYGPLLLGSPPAIPKRCLA